MCEKCAQLGEKIVHCKRLKQTTDQPTLDGIAILIGQYEAQKRELHPNRVRPPQLAAHIHWLTRILTRYELGDKGLAIRPIEAHVYATTARHPASIGDENARCAPASR
jgi:hypothetical protein